MDPSTWDILVPAITALLGALTAYLTARAAYTRKLEAAIQRAEPTEDEQSRRLVRRETLSEDVRSVVSTVVADWQDKTPERVTRERCDSKHDALKEQINGFTEKLEQLTGKVQALAEQVAGLAGEVRRINGRSETR